MTTAAPLLWELDPTFGMAVGGAGRNVRGGHFEVDYGAGMHCRNCSGEGARFGIVLWRGCCCTVDRGVGSRGSGVGG